MRALYTTITAILIACAVDADAKSFFLARVHSDIAVRTDGTVRVVESLAYSFEGSFSYAFRTIPLRRGDRIFDVTVFEGDNAYAESISEIPGSYTVTRRGGEVVIKWYYRARNEKRTFDIGYTLEGAVTRYADVADFYLTLFSNETGTLVRGVSADVSLPPGLGADDLKVFAHGPTHGVVEVISGERVRASVAPLSNHDFLDVRVLTPPELFGAMTAGDEPMRARIIAQETEWAAAADRERAAAAERQRRYRFERERRSRLIGKLLPIAIGLGILSVVVWFAYFRRHGWPHEVAVHASPGDPPSDHAPALVSYLVAKSVGAPAMVATLVDLSERGYLSITESQREKGGLFGRTSVENDYRFERREGRDALLPFERDLLEFMVEVVGNGREFSMSELKQYARKHRSQVQKWFAAWAKMVKEVGKREGFFEPYEASAVMPNVIMGLFVLGAGITIVAITKSPAGAPAMAGGFLQGILSLALTRHTPEGRRLALAWKGFRDHLKKTSKAMGKVTLASGDWSRYLSIAILFGIHKKLLPVLALSDARGTHAYPVWYSAAMGTGGSGVSGLADGFSTMVTSVTSTMSSSTGAGGGASAGGGGGGGGGSAGAG